jgi:hypothetical protein
MASMLSSLLFRAEVVQPQGRLIRFDQKEAAISFATGTMAERVISFLSHEQCPMTAKEIAQGIHSNASRVTATVNKLMTEGVVERVKLEGCTSQYCLAKQSVRG